MEEKERYEYFFGTNTIKDNINKEFLSYKRVIDTLNQQDKRIKELEEELKNYKLCRCVDCSSEYEYGLETSIDELEKENQQLKQQLHDLPKKIVRDVADELSDCGKAYLECEPYIKICIVKSILQAILKKYGGEDESNND